MAWELQSHMVGYIAPSVHKAAQDNDDPHAWLCERYADQRWDEGAGLMAHTALVKDARLFAQDTLIKAIAEHAATHATTTNGGWAVYLDGWTSVEWCTENEMLAWYG